MGSVYALKQHRTVGRTHERQGSGSRKPAVDVSRRGRPLQPPGSGHCAAFRCPDHSPTSAFVSRLCRGLLAGCFQPETASCSRENGRASGTLLILRLSFPPERRGRNPAESARELRDPALVRRESVSGGAAVCALPPALSCRLSRSSGALIVHVAVSGLSSRGSGPGSVLVGHRSPVLEAAA